MEGSEERSEVGLYDGIFLYLSRDEQQCFEPSEGERRMTQYNADVNLGTNKGKDHKFKIIKEKE